MKWHEILTEDTDRILFYKHIRGHTSLYRALTSKQTDELIKKLEDYRDAIVSKFLMELETEDDTSVIGVRFNNIAFGLYGRNGDARIAMGPAYSEVKILNQYLDIDKFIKAL